MFNENKNIDLSDVKTFEELKKRKSEVFGPKGTITSLFNQIRQASQDEKARLGKKASQLKKQAEVAFANKAKEIASIEMETRLKEEWVDINLPQKNKVGFHPLTLIEQRFREWFLQNGFYENEGSEIENDVYNFQKLNISKDHPAREMQNSIYINKHRLLRTHNTGFSARELQNNKNKAFSSFVIGKVYRNDDDDLTHSHQFTQVDFVSVGYVSFSNLIWTLKSLLTYVLEEEVKVRLRPSFFPFTEPSAEVDIFYENKWIEVLGSGMIHENVMKMAGYTNDMDAFASGVGIERVAMIKYGISDIREFFKNDMRFLKQFN